MLSILGSFLHKKQEHRVVPDLNGNLIISNVSTQDSGTYGCMIENGQRKNIELQR